MTQNQANWHQALLFLAMGGVFFVSPQEAIAQRIPIPDDTLGNERSLVSPDQMINDLSSNAIDGGAQRGANLFHSFREFNVDVGRGVYFTNPVGVTNILTRVTGNSRSEIFGTLGVLGTANLFLLNPNGILFGPGAQLDIRGGSFIASTANSVLFNNGFAFSATNPQAPPLLTVNVPIGLQYGSNPGEIRSQGARLQMRNGQTLTLAGGAVTVDGGQLFAFGGRVEVAGVADAGEVGLTQQGQEWRLSVPDGLARADVSLTNRALVNVAAGGGGHIAIAARNLELTEGSGLQAGIGRGLGSSQAQAGNITIQAAENVTIQGGRFLSFIDNSVNSGGMGNAGDIIINARSLFVTNGAPIGSTTLGDGSGGNITINATDSVRLVGTSTNGRFLSGLFAQTDSRSKAGNITINTRNLIVGDGAQVGSATFGDGTGGNLTVNASESVQLIGSGGLLAQTLNRGDAGNISINTRNLIIRDGAQISSTTFGDGAGGNLTVNASDLVQLIGTSARGIPSALFSGSNSLSLSSDNRGKAGNISIDTRNLIVSDGAQVSSGTFTEGAGGNLTVNASDSIQVIGRSADGRRTSLLSTQTQNRGNAGNLDIKTGNLIVSDGAQVTSGTFGEGAGGNLTIYAADLVRITGISKDGRASSGLFSQAENRGKAGDVTIGTRNLIVSDGAQVSSGTRGDGAGGNLTVNASDSIQVIGKSVDGRFVSLLTARTTASGNAGDLMLKTRQFIIKDGGQVSSQQSTATATGGVGNINLETRSLSITNNARITVEDRRTSGDRQETEPVGNINIQTNFLTLDRSSISAETASTNGGNINLNVQDVLLLRNGSLISTNAGTAQAGGNGGNITFNGKFIVAIPKENSDISANAFTGRGGRVEITAQGLFGIQFRPQLTPLSDITASSTFGIAGVVSINTPNVDPNRGLVQLPVDLSDASRLIVQTCPTDSGTAKQPNEFIITGRGGLPPTPSDAINRDAIQVDLVTANDEEQSSVLHREPNNNRPSLTTDTSIVEAQTIQVAADGTVYLVAVAPQNAIAPSPNRPIHCP